MISVMNIMGFSVLYEFKLKLFDFWTVDQTKKDIKRCYFALRKLVMRINGIKMPIDQSIIDYQKL